MGNSKSVQLNVDPGAVATVGLLDSARREIAQAIRTKANEAEFDSHVKDAVKHVTVAERTKWDGKMETTGDSKDNTVAFSSGDAASPSGWADIEVMTSGEKHSSLFRKMSLAVKNLRYLWRLLGTTSLAGIGDGTVTGAISSLNTGLVQLHIPHISAKSEAALVADLDAVADADGIWYRRHYSLTFTAGIWGNYGGNWYVEGMRVDLRYEWQVATSYGHPVKKFVRSKYAGIWCDWANIATSCDYISYGSIASKVTSDDPSKLAIEEAYVENRTIVIRLIIKEGSIGLLTAKITDIRLAPRCHINGLYAAMTHGGDANKCNGAWVSSHGNINVWMAETLVDNESVTFVYPICCV